MTMQWKWATWFAWYPVKTTNSKWAWFVRVERKTIWKFYGTDASDAVTRWIYQEM